MGKIAEYLVRGIITIFVIVCCYLVPPAVVLFGWYLIARTYLVG